MLDYIWCGIFLISSVIAAFHSYQLHDERKFEKAGNWLFGSTGLAFLPLLITWEPIGFRYWMSVRDFLPQTGEMISEATALILVVLTAALYLALTQYIGEAFHYLLKRKNKGLSLPFNKRLAAIDEVLNGYQNGYGIYKRIDENRELLELLKKECPEFLEDHFWIEGWLESHDQFFSELALAAKTKNRRVNIRNFPRPWPGTNLSYAPKV